MRGFRLSVIEQVHTLSCSAPQLTDVTLVVLTLRLSHSCSTSWRLQGHWHGNVRASVRVLSDDDLMEYHRP